MIKNSKHFDVIRLPSSVDSDSSNKHLKIIYKRNAPNRSLTFWYFFLPIIRQNEVCLSSSKKIKRTWDLVWPEQKHKQRISVSGFQGKTFPIIQKKKKKLTITKDCDSRIININWISISFWKILFFHWIPYWHFSWKIRIEI